MIEDKLDEQHLWAEMPGSAVPSIDGSIAGSKKTKKEVDLLYGSDMLYGLEGLQGLDSTDLYGGSSNMGENARQIMGITKKFLVNFLDAYKNDGDNKNSEEEYFVKFI